LVGCRPELIYSLRNSFSIVSPFLGLARKGRETAPKPICIDVLFVLFIRSHFRSGDG
jgi:hypothetical protein